MGTRNESILNQLVQCPWWVSVVISGASYLFLKFILPSIDFGSMMANSFAKGISSAAPFVAFVLLLPALIAALNSFLKRRRGI
jgi:restriction system protein